MLWFAFKKEHYFCLLFHSLHFGDILQVLSKYDHLLTLDHSIFYSEVATESYCGLGTKAAGLLSKRRMAARGDKCLGKRDI